MRRRGSRARSSTSTSAPAADCFASGAALMYQGYAFQGSTMRGEMPCVSKRRACRSAVGSSFSTLRKPDPLSLCAAGPGSRRMLKIFVSNLVDERVDGRHVGLGMGSCLLGGQEGGISHATGHARTVMHSRRPSTELSHVGAASRASSHRSQPNSIALNLGSHTTRPLTDGAVSTRGPGGRLASYVVVQRECSSVRQRTVRLPD
jgi:hypothetical protein